MKRVTKKVLTVSGLVSLAVGYAWAQNAPAVTTQTSTMTATVQSVYPDKRSITLVGPDGQARSIFVGPDVRLNLVHAGDKVNVTYQQGIAAEIAKGNTKVTDPAAADFAYRNKDAAGGGAGTSVTVGVKILGVSPANNTVLFQEKDGSQHVIEVKSPQMREFIRTLKAGDHVNVTFTESVALTVTPAS